MGGVRSPSFRVFDRRHFETHHGDVNAAVGWGSSTYRHLGDGRRPGLLGKVIEVRGVFLSRYTFIFPEAFPI